MFKLIYFLCLIFGLGLGIYVSSTQPTYDFRTTINEAYDRQMLFLYSVPQFNTMSMITNFAPQFSNTMCFGQSTSVFSVTSIELASQKKWLTYLRRTSILTVSSPVLYSPSCNFSMLNSTYATFMTSVTVPIFFNVTVQNREISLINPCSTSGGYCKKDTQSGAISGYYTTWSNYGRFDPYDDIPYTGMNQLFYAFMSADPTTGTITSRDTAGDKWGLRVMARAKLVYPHIRTIISIGGSGGTVTQSSKFTTVCADTTKTDTLINDSINFMRNMMADGIDIDWEWWSDYAFSAAPASAYLSLVQKFRTGLNNAGQADGRYYNLTIAYAQSVNILDATQNSSSAVSNFWSQISDLVDQINVMSYEILNGKTYGSYSYYQSNYGIYNPNTTIKTLTQSMNLTILKFNGYGVPNSKLLWGTALQAKTLRIYNTNSSMGGLLQPNNGTGFGDRQGGVFDLKCLRNQTMDAKRGCAVNTSILASLSSLVYYDQTRNTALYNLYGLPAMQPWAFDPTTNNFLTFDNPYSMTLKTTEARRLGMRGMCFWALDGDARGTDSLMAQASRQMFT